MTKVNKNDLSKLPEFIDRKGAADLMGVTTYWLEKTPPEAPSFVRHGRKAWYKTAEVLERKAYRDAEQARRAAEKAAGGFRPTPQPSDDELSRAFEGAAWQDPHPDVSAHELIVQRARAKPRWRMDLEGVETWPTGVYETPMGLIIRRRRAS